MLFSKNPSQVDAEGRTDASYSPSGEITSTSSIVLRSDLRLGLSPVTSATATRQADSTDDGQTVPASEAFLAVGPKNRLDRSPYQILVHAVLQGLLVHKECLPDALYGPLDVIVRMRETDHE